MKLSKQESIERTEKYAQEGFLCSEAVLMALSEALGLESEYIPRIASGLAAGVARQGEICGAVSGAILALGMKYGRDKVEVSERRPYWFSHEFTETFKKQYGELSCQGLLGLKLDNPDDYDVYYEKDMWNTKCRSYIREAVRIGYELLEK